MNMRLIPKEANALLPTDILFQTVYWSRVKSELGWKPHAFDIASSGSSSDMLVLTKSLGGIKTAYVPQGPEHRPDPDRYGCFLEELSDAIREHLDPTLSFIRYDLPWESQYSAGKGGNSHPQTWGGRPEARLRELRMNFGTKSWNLRKAPLDLTVADSVIIDLTGTEEEILANMKPKTRYNIRLAERKKVEVLSASADMLPTFYDLYRQTADRNGFSTSDFVYFSALFSVHTCRHDSSEIHFLLAKYGRDILAGAIVGISGTTAIYLFGASSNQNRNLMGPYALQWTAIRLARAKGCRVYDMGAVPPTGDPNHPFYGMYRFKIGFGGSMVHRSGSWDFPIDANHYATFRNTEMLDMSLP